MDAVGIIGLAASISLLSGWRLYLCVFATGLAMHVGWIALPQQLHSLDVLAHWWAIGGALLALAIVDPHDAKWQVIALLLGGGAALLTHGAKAGTRAAVNASPEPFSNIAVSTGEDVATTGLLVASIASPWAAVVIAVLVLVAAVAMLLLLRRAFRRLFPKKQPPEAT